MSLNDIMGEVNKKLIYGDDLELAVQTFIEDLIHKMNDIFAKQAYASTVSLKDKLIERFVLETSTALLRYDTITAEKSLEWSRLGKKWGKLRFVGELEKQSVNFKKELVSTLNNMRSESEKYLERLGWLKSKYELTIAESKKLVGVGVKLSNLKNLKYEKFIASLKNGELYQV